MSELDPDQKDQRIAELERQLTASQALADRFHRALTASYAVALAAGGDPRHGELDAPLAVEDLARRLLLLEAVSVALAGERTSLGATAFAAYQARMGGDCRPGWSDLTPSAREAFEAAAAAVGTGRLAWKTVDAIQNEEGTFFWVIETGAATVLLGQRGDVANVTTGGRIPLEPEEWGFWCGDEFLPDARVAWCAPLEFPAPPPGLEEACPLCANRPGCTAVEVGEPGFAKACSQYAPPAPGEAAQ